MPIPKGENHPRWNGGRKMARGYIKLLKPGHPDATDGRYVFEHRFIMSEHIGRQLFRDEVVHHINGIKNDNQIENLVILKRSQHQSHHASGKRKSHCKHGHAFSEANTIWRKDNQRGTIRRDCRTCHNGSIRNRLRRLHHSVRVNKRKNFLTQAALGTHAL